jgi:hypothetical protein
MKGRSEMRELLRGLLLVAAMGVALSAYGCGAGVSTGVYVGVAVPGPYVGYPGYGRPGYIGRPPYVYEEDALNLLPGSGNNVALSTDSPLEAVPACGWEAQDAACEKERGRQAVRAADEGRESADVEPGGR